jgi:hypothetical protein
MILKKIAMMLIVLAMSTTVGAQNTDEIYAEAKALYDAKNYKAALPKLKIAAEKGHKPRTTSWPMSGTPSRLPRTMPKDNWRWANAI